MLIICLLTVVTFPAYAFELILTADEQSWLDDHPTIVFGGELDWPPFDFVDENGNYVLGFS